MTAPDTASILWVDAAGNPGSSRFHVPAATTDAQIVEVADAMQALSEMRAESALRTKTYDYAGDVATALGPDAPYADDRAALVLSFEVPSTSQHCFLSIPGPKSSIAFGNDGRINPDDAGFTALKSAVAAAMTTQEGASVGQLERGALRVKRAPRVS